MEERSLQGVIQAALTAEEAGVSVDWKSLCLQTYDVAMAEINRLQPEPDAPDPVDTEEDCSDPD